MLGGMKRVLAGFDGNGVYIRMLRGLFIMKLHNLKFMIFQPDLGDVLIEHNCTRERGEGKSSLDVRLSQIAM